MPESETGPGLPAGVETLAHPAILAALIFFASTCSGPPVIEDKSAFTDFSLQRLGCICEDCIQEAIITRESDGSYLATRLRGASESFTLTEDETSALLDMMRS